MAILTRMKNLALLASLICALGAISSAQAYTIPETVSYRVSAGEFSVAGIAAFPLDISGEDFAQPPGSTASTRFNAAVVADASQDTLSLNASASLLDTVGDIGCGENVCYPPSGSSTASLIVEFHLDVATRYSLEGSVFFTPGEAMGGINGSGGVSLVARNPDGSVAIIQSVVQAGATFPPTTNTPLAFFATGLLEPGDYVLGASSNTTLVSVINAGFGFSDLGESHANVLLTFNPVPLPAAFWLLVSAMGGLAGVRRRQGPACRAPEGG